MSYFVFAGSGVRDVDALLADLDWGNDAVELDSEEDGGPQILQALEGASSRDDIRIVSQGSSGTLFLSASASDGAALYNGQAGLVQIGASLTERGDMLLVGRDMADGGVSADILSQLASYTGAEEPASTHYVASSSLEGNPTLLSTAGAIAAISPGDPDSVSTQGHIPGGGASVQLPILETNFTGLNANVDSLNDRVEQVESIIDSVNAVVSIPGHIEEIADVIGTLADEGAVIAKTLQKIGALKSIATVFETALKNISTQIGKLEDKAKEIADLLEPLTDGLDSAEDYLENTIQPLIESASNELGETTQSIADAHDNLEVAHDVVSLLNPADPIAVNFNNLALGVDTALQPVNGLIGDANADYASVDSKLNALLTKLNTSLDANILVKFGKLIDMERQASNIAQTLTDLAAPLVDVLNSGVKLIGAIADKAVEVLDFFTFGLASKALDAASSAFDFILEATGIKGLMNDAANAISDLLLGDTFDVNILNDIQAPLVNAAEDIVDITNVSLPDNPFADLLDNFLPSTDTVLNASAFQSTGTNGDDTFLGTLEDDTYNGLAGADMIIGGVGNDALNGGAGIDILIGGAGNDVLDGGSERDTAIYTGILADYILFRLPDGTWNITDKSGRTTVENEGADVLTDVEDLVFSDQGLAIDEITGQFIVTTATEGVTHLVSPTGGEFLSTADADRIQGNNAFDVLQGGNGDDTIVGQINNNLGGSSLKYGDELYGDVGNDTIQLGTVYDVVDGGAGVDTAVFRGALGGTANVLLTVAGEEPDFVRPSSSLVWMSESGQPGLVGDTVATIENIENLIGSDSADKFWGTSGENNLRGGPGDDHIRGLDGDDMLYGDDGDDTLIGDRGNDTVDGGRGDDLFVGGSGNDSYIGGGRATFGDSVLYSLSHTGESNGYVDRFEGKLDAIEFSTTGYLATGFDLPHHIIVNPTVSGPVTVDKYDSTNTLIGQDTLDGVRYIYGTVNDDVLHGLPNQVLHGGEGNDQIFASKFFEGPNEVGTFTYGGIGNDTFVGGPGGDSFWGEQGNDTILIAGSEGIGDNDSYAGGSGVDTLDLSGSDYSWHIFFDVSSGNGDVLAKSLRPINSSEAADSKYIQPVNGIPLELKQVDPTQEWTGGRVVDIQHFEIFQGSDFRDIISMGWHGAVQINSSQQKIDDAAEVKVYGNGGGDVIFGAQTGGQLFGGDGDDTMGTFNATRIGGLNDQGPMFDTRITTYLYGEAGDDLFVAGDSQEAFDGGAGNDTLTYEATNFFIRDIDTGALIEEGVTVNLQTGIASRGYARGDSVTGIENVTGSGLDDQLTGDGNANVLVGWAGADTLSGGGGNDVLYGNEGNDTLSGGDGDDTLHGGEGTDTFDGGAGTDTASWAQYQLHPQGGENQLVGDTTGVVADLQTGLAGSETLTSIENLTGSVGDDQFFGDDNLNTLVGAGGNDELRGRGGDDALSGGAGNDQLFGDAGDDWLSGGLGNNFIDGGSGLDVLDYGELTRGVIVEMPGAGSRAGQDTGIATSETDIDVAVWADTLTTEAREVVPGGSSVTPDRLFKLSPAFAEFPADLIPIPDLPEVLPPALQLAVVNGVAGGVDTFRDIEIISGSLGNDSFLGNAEANGFQGNAGDDTLTGAAGNDTLIGGQGDDMLDGGADVDQAVFEGLRADYAAVSFGNEAVVADLVGGRDGVDVLLDVESVAFRSDGKVALLNELSTALEYTASYLDLINAFGTNAAASFQHFKAAGASEGRGVTFSGLDYIASYGDLIGAFGVDSEGGTIHYITAGQAEGRQVSFDGLQYVAGYDDLIAGIGADEVAAAQHFIAAGFAEGRVTDSFDARYYLGSYADLRNAFGTDQDAATVHFITSGSAEGRDRNDFDPLEYIASYADLSNAFGTDAALGNTHFLDAGFNEGRGDNFDGLDYIASYGDLIGAFGLNSAGGTSHFITAGRAEGRQISFDGLEYLATYDDLILAFGDDQDAAARHYIDSGFGQGRVSDGFDGRYYLGSYTDLRGLFGTNETAAAEHFVVSGFAEGRARNDFDPLEYIASYGDLIGALGVDAAAGDAHFLAAGFNEGRGDTFDGLEYIATYGDLIAAFGTNDEAGTMHYITAGNGEGRVEDFDPQQYLDNYADLQAAFGSDLEAATLHYITAGFAEGRTDDVLGG